jgi:hypothetical protein
MIKNQGVLSIVSDCTGAVSVWQKIMLNLLILRDLWYGHSLSLWFTSQNTGKIKKFHVSHLKMMNTSEVVLAVK